MIDAQTRSSRITALTQRLAESRVELAVFGPTDNLRYLLGFAPKADERACLLVVSPHGAACVMPGLNADQTATRVPDLELVRWSDDVGAAGALAQVLSQLQVADAKSAAVDPELRADHLLLLMAALPDAKLIDTTTVLGPLRESKDGDEITLLQRSSDLADIAVGAAFAALAVGKREDEIADAVAQAFAAGGATLEFAIVGTGANGAFPHHQTGSQRIAGGDAVVIDIGGRLDGYVSDITRMAFIGQPTPRYREVHAIVEAAVLAGLEASKPGATCADVDEAARGVITDAGYGEYFLHRTGHGLGLSVHEPPWIMQGNEVELRPGVVHSIEPGIYLPGEFGVRLEEIVHVTETGCERFSSLPRSVHIID